MKTQIFEVTQYDEKIIEALNALLPQLSKSALPVSENELREIIDSPSTQLFIAKENESYLGCLTLVTFTIPTGKRALIEDVVVSQNARGKGIGKLLTQTAIHKSKEMGIKTVDLTSRPSRVEANNLYRKTGFKLRQTNVYRYTVD